MGIYNFLIIFLLNQSLAHTMRYDKSHQHNFQSSIYQNSLEYKTNSLNNNLISDSINNQNSYFFPQNSQYDNVQSNSKHFESVTQSPYSSDKKQRKDFWSSENEQQFFSQKSASRSYFESTTLSSNIDNNSQKFGLSDSMNHRKLLDSSNAMQTISYNTPFEESYRNDRNSRGASSTSSLKVKSKFLPENRSKINGITKNTSKISNHSSRKENKRISERKYEEFSQQIFKDNNDSENDVKIHYRRANFDGREIVDPGEYPHMTAIGYRRLDQSIDWKCGGSLIDEYFVITAAHCTDFSGQKPSLIKIGDINLKVREKSIEPQTISIKNIYNHPNYTKSSYYNDIALLRLKKRVIFTQFVRPIRLYIKTNIPYDTVFAMGYGATAFGKAKTNVLTDLNLTIVRNNECNQKLPKDPKTTKGIIDSQICAIDKDGNRDTCQGDSGGPLQLNLLDSKRIQYHLIGITSYGLFCGTEKPSVYTRISSFIDWIEKIVWLGN